MSGKNKGQRAGNNKVEGTQIFLNREDESTSLKMLLNNHADCSSCLEVIRVKQYSDNGRRSSGSSAGAVGDTQNLIPPYGISRDSSTIWRKLNVFSSV